MEYSRCLQQEQLALDRRLRALEQQPRPAVLPPFPHRTLTPEEQEAAASRRLALAAEEGNQISVLSRNSQLGASPAAARRKAPQTPATLAVSAGRGSVSRQPLATAVSHSLTPTPTPTLIMTLARWILVDMGTPIP
ncbi:hypothetical protein D9Q98_009148 [Chlorella vulgaris]|uniref:Uncharacterized protein n=1 Tax=Chlorella vulgaris TaxID=3077 RepID=A0A9D4TH89_CHLVU|nr:hypothetical protein D9Q98_009148 [Chlorella vulgaris]